MATFLFTFVFFTAVLTAMAVGVLFAKKPLKGTCGGLSTMTDRFGESMCDICDGDPAKKPSDCDDH